MRTEEEQEFGHKSSKTPCEERADPKTKIGNAEPKHRNKKKLHNRRIRPNVRKRANQDKSRQLRETRLNLYREQTHAVPQDSQTLQPTTPRTIGKKKQREEDPAETRGDDVHPVTTLPPRTKEVTQKEQKKRFSHSRKSTMSDLRKVMNSVIRDS